MYSEQCTGFCIAPDGWKEEMIETLLHSDDNGAASVMSINLFQALILGLFASLSSMPGMGSSSIGNYTLGRPLVGGLVCGLVLGDLKTGILVGVAMQIVYIALVTPGGTVSADVRAVSYIGIPLAMLAIKSQGLDPASEQGMALATSFGAIKRSKKGTTSRSSL